MPIHGLPQRSARSITANSNHTPQDPPGPPTLPLHIEEMATQSQMDRVYYVEQQITLLMTKYGVTI